MTGIEVKFSVLIVSIDQYPFEAQLLGLQIDDDRDIVGSLSNYDDDDDDDDDKDNVKKTIGLMSKTFALHVHHAFSTFLWRPLHDYDVKPPNATFCGGRGHTTTNCPFSIWTWKESLRIQLQENSPTFDEMCGFQYTR